MKFYKKKYFLLFFLILLVNPIYLKAASIDLGFSSWYTWWSQAASTKDNFSQSIIPSNNASVYIPPNNPHKMNILPGFIFGPVLSVNLPKNISITSKFLYGEFKAKKKDQFILNLLLFDKIGYIRRYNPDIILRYNILTMLDFFTGFDYNHYSINILSLSQSYSSFIISGKRVTKIKSEEYAPLVGLGVAVPVIKNVLTIQIDAAFLFCFTKELKNEYSLGRTEFSPDITFVPPRNIKKNYKKIGTKANFGIIYYVPVIPISVSLGFRYQMYKRLFIQKDKALEYEHLYGITASINYRFNIQ